MVNPDTCTRDAVSEKIWHLFLLERSEGVKWVDEVVVVGWAKKCLVSM